MYHHINEAIIEQGFRGYGKKFPKLVAVAILMK